MATKVDRTEARARLEVLYKKNRRRLTARKVLEDARAASSPLHRFFDWDDSRAAEKYRLQQARELIVSFVVLPTPASAPVAEFVSLVSDRAGGGGYRQMVDVCNNATLLADLKLTLLAEVRSMLPRYQMLAKLGSPLPRDLALAAGLRDLAATMSGPAPHKKGGSTPARKTPPRRPARGKGVKKR